MTDLWGCWKFYYIKIKEIHGGQKAFLLNNTSLSECAATKQCFQGFHRWLRAEEDIDLEHQCSFVLRMIHVRKPSCEC